MKANRRFLGALFVVIATAVAPSWCAAQIAVRAETLYTSAGAPLKDGLVLVQGGKVASVGPASSLKVPSGYRILSAKVVTPGLIDAHTVVGLSGYLNRREDQDELEKSAPVQPELRAVDAYNPRERLVEYLRSFGVTTIHTGHGPGALVSGQTMVIKTIGTADDGKSLLVQTAMIAATLGSGALAEQGKSPGSRSKMIAMLRSEFIGAREYLLKLSSEPEDKKPARDLRKESLGRVLKGEIPILVTVYRAGDIMSALRLAKEFGIKIVLDGAAEAYLVVDQIKAAGVPVIIHPTMFRAAGDAENLSFETAAVLHKAGIRVALQSGFESYVPKTRVVLFEAGVAAANGLSFEEALATITIDAARILKIDNRVGSLEPGKDADMALFDGDPFEYTSHVTGVIIDGNVVSEEVH